MAPRATRVPLGTRTPSIPRRLGSATRFVRPRRPDSSPRENATALPAGGEHDLRDAHDPGPLDGHPERMRSSRPASYLAERVARSILGEERITHDHEAGRRARAQQAHGRLHEMLVPLPEADASHDPHQRRGGIRALLRAKGRAIDPGMELARVHGVDDGDRLVPPAAAREAGADRIRVADDPRGERRQGAVDVAHGAVRRLRACQTPAAARRPPSPHPVSSADRWSAHGHAMVSDGRATLRTARRNQHVSQAEGTARSHTVRYDACGNSGWPTEPVGNAPAGGYA